MFISIFVETIKNNIMNKAELKQELEKFAEFQYNSPYFVAHNDFAKVVDTYLSSLEPKQPELKGISDVFQNFTNELKSMGL